ncbi:ATP synthase j chain-domain-containing protein [Daldinia caldariorum]|uniref:ATP synthase j chain-domain-containing protein n=1 Tax=Daldinia caldariorum TaxID=326644 RepID=UPI002007BECB|nr:ATP synthase j chain-domain-containing protein [Daldinia caldariorum]KAI1468398.1 ATP synthase j chain-domain-containing protein [Daldinia caldariorum]
MVARIEVLSISNLDAFYYYSDPSNNVFKMSKLSWFGAYPLKKFPTPVLKPYAPFYVAGLIILYGVNAAQNAMMKSDEWKNDPRNPYAKSGGH